MALDQHRTEPASTDRHMSHDASVRVHDRVEQVLGQEEERTLERRETELQEATSDSVREGDSARAQGKRGKRRQASLERAHRSVTGTREALPGAPRSGSA